MRRDLVLRLGRLRCGGLGGGTFVVLVVQFLGLSWSGRRLVRFAHVSIKLAVDCGFSKRSGEATSGRRHIGRLAIAT